MNQQINYTNEQLEAITMCADPTIKIACVTGQAGSGKTSILGEAYRQAFDNLCNKFGLDPEEAIRREKDALPFSIQLAAPTGRAAKRIEEATSYKAMTIHRMLRFSVPENDEDKGMPAHTKMNPMPHDFIFIDEASMLTDEIRRSLIDAMKRGSVIRFFGDINQLPPIGSHSPFAVDLKKQPSVTLTENFRSNDGIISLADKVIKNRMPLNNEKVTIQRVVSQHGSLTVLKLAEEIDFTTDVNQIICPTNHTKHGTVNLNRSIQQRFNPNKEKITVYQRNSHDQSMIVKSFKRDDKILWTKNDYNLDLMNGTLGRVLDFDEDTGSIFISVDGRDIEIPSQMETFNPTTGIRYTYDPRHRLDLGYAISTHKSQGSQFHTVCFVCSRSRAATRQNVYTAVTRAAERLHIINIGGSLAYALSNNTDIMKKT